MKHEFKCSQCSLDKIYESEVTTGYATNKHSEKVCFDCCGINDANVLKMLPVGGKAFQYFNGKEIINWPGTLRIPINYVRKGNHNIARHRYDMWFKFEGNSFHAVQFGDNTQIAHIRRVKS